jgi:hypothetical protein
LTLKNAQVAKIIPRRSRRIAGVGVEFDKMDLCSSSRTTKKVMQALKVIGDPGAITQQAKEDYLKVFSTELPLSHIEALASFFGWVVPDDLKLGSISVGISAC